MKKIPRKKLMWLSIITFVASVALVVTGVLVINFGTKMQNKTSLILMCVGGSLLLLAAFLGLIFAFITMCISIAMVKTLGSQRDDNIALSGTENANLCPNCGSVLDGEFCTNCGKSAKGQVCPKCGSKNPQEATFCKNCGTELK